MAQSNTTESALVHLREALAQRTGTRACDWHLVFKARYGMREVFRTLREVRGEGHVVTTLFTGCTAADSIVASGLAPAYADIDPATLTVDAQALEVDENVRAVIVQHSYGMIDCAKTAACAAKAHTAGALVVEDSAHCVTRMARDAAGKPIADISIHSMGIEKQLGVGFGGAIWVNPAMDDANLYAALTRAFETLPPLPEKIDAAVRRYRNQNRVLAHLPRAVSGPARAHLAATGRLELPVADMERRGRLPYPSYLPSEWIAQRILDGLSSLNEDEANRIAWTKGYLEALEGLNGIEIPEAARTVAREQSLIRFPIVLPSEAAADPLIAELRGNHLYCVDWYRMPFYPGAFELAPYNMSEDDPRYQGFFKRYGGIVGLPTDIDIARLPDAIEIVRRHIQA